MEVELKELLEVKETTIQIPKMRPVRDLRRLGRAAPARGPETCTRCRGAGQLMFQQGFFRISRPCDACGGAGEVVKDRCTACRGAGRIEGEQTLHVKIPAGIEHGTRLRLAGEGEAGIEGGPAGRSLRRRRGEAASALRARRQRPPLPGADPVRAGRARRRDRGADARRQGVAADSRRHAVGQDLPAARQGTAVARRRARAATRSCRSSSRCRRKLTERQRELLEQFARDSGTEVSPVTKGFLDKLRDFLG